MLSHKFNLILFSFDNWGPPESQLQGDSLLWSTCGFAAVLPERVAASKQIFSLRGPEHLAYTGVYLVYLCLALQSVKPNAHARAGAYDAPAAVGLQDLGLPRMYVSVALAKGDGDTRPGIKIREISSPLREYPL